MTLEDNVAKKEKKTRPWISRYEELKSNAIKSRCDVCTFTRDQYMRQFRVSDQIANRDIKFMLIYGLIEEPRLKKGKFKVIL